VFEAPKLQERFVPGLVVVTELHIALAGGEPTNCKMLTIVGGDGKSVPVIVIVPVLPRATDDGLIEVILGGGA
jgi:hypothetical protein